MPDHALTLPRAFAVAVSGGADSVCLTYLARGWGRPLALIVDHGLRPESAGEAYATAHTLACLGVPSQILKLRHLAPGPGLAARARAARYAALTEATIQAGLTDLLLGHHAGDQAETYVIRTASQSGPFGLACMAAVTETPEIRLIRPLLGTRPETLRAILRARKIPWVEDPSNGNPAATRTRVRLRLAQPGDGARAMSSILALVHASGLARSTSETRIAATLAERATIFPEGFAVLTPGPIEPDALAALIRALTGAAYPARGAAVHRLAAGRMMGTLGGLRLLSAGRLGPGTLLVREPVAMEPPIAAESGCLWDRRFRLATLKKRLKGLMLGALDEDAARFRKQTGLPSAVLKTLPALRHDGLLLAVPHLGYFKGWTKAQVRLTFCPTTPAAGVPFKVFTMGDAVPPEQHHVPDEAEAAHPGDPGSPPGLIDRKPRGL